MMEPDDITLALTPVARCLERLGVPYMICGSVASSALGVARATLDVDLVADLRSEHGAAFASELIPDYYADEEMIEEAIRQRGSFNVIHLQTMLKVDVFILKQTAWDLTAFGRAASIRLEEGVGREFSLASPEDVVLHKLLWFQMGGEVADRQWRDVVGVLKVQADHLDWEYMRKWANEIGVTELLDRAAAT